MECSSKYKLLSNERGSSWSYGSWIYNYRCNQCISTLTLRVLMPLREGVLDTTLCDKVSQWLADGRWFSPGTPVSSTNKTDRHDITEILLKVTLSTKTLTLYLAHVFTLISLTKNYYLLIYVSFIIIWSQTSSLPVFLSGLCSS
jgi:hypothetical protein